MLDCLKRGREPHLAHRQSLPTPGLEHFLTQKKQCLCLLLWLNQVAWIITYFKGYFCFHSNFPSRQTGQQKPLIVPLRTESNSSQHMRLQPPIYSLNKMVEFALIWESRTLELGLQWLRPEMLKWLDPFLTLGELHKKKKKPYSSFNSVTSSQTSLLKCPRLMPLSSELTLLFAQTPCNSSRRTAFLFHSNIPYSPSYLS